MILTIMHNVEYDILILIKRLLSALLLYLTE
jgi:hypothetical protein